MSIKLYMRDRRAVIRAQIQELSDRIAFLLMDDEIDTLDKKMEAVQEQHARLKELLADYVIEQKAMLKARAEKGEKKA